MRTRTPSSGTPSYTQPPAVSLIPYVRTTEMPAAEALSPNPPGIGPPPISTASSDASAFVAAGSRSALSNCAATSDAYRRPDPNDATAEANSAPSNPADTATGAAPATTLRTSTCRPADVIGGQRQQPSAGTTEPAVRGFGAGGQRRRGEHRPLGRTRRARRRHHHRNVVVDRLTRLAKTLSVKSFGARRRPAPEAQTRVRQARPPTPAAPTALTRLTGRRRGAGRLFGLLGVTRVIERPALGGQSLPDPLDVLGRGNSSVICGDQHADVDVVELAARPTTSSRRSPPRRR